MALTLIPSPMLTKPLPVAELTAEQFSAYCIDGSELISTPTNHEFGFLPQDYSRFKYGSKSLARRFGRELADRLLNSETFTSLLPALANPYGIVIYPSPYNFVPTATFALKDYFVARYNEVAIPRHGLAPLQEGKIFRSYSYNEDYGAMSKTERDAAISGDDFYIDVEFARGKTLIFLDDIRVTGSHEGRIRHLLNKTGLVAQAHLFLYFAQVSNSAQCDPTVENKLNYAAVHNLLSIDNIIKNDEFLFNTRVVKYILSAELSQFITFIQYQSKTFRHTLLHCAYGNSYHLQPAFESAIQVLTEMVHHDGE